MASDQGGGGDRERIGGKSGRKSKGLTGEVTRLARLLYVEAEQTSMRDLEARTGVSRGVLERLFRGKRVGKLEIETYDKIAAYLDLPLWKVLELDGVAIDLPPQSNLSAQLAQLIGDHPELQPLLRHLGELRPHQTRAVLAYVQMLIRETSGRASDAPPDPPA
mgnify:CR=1 FL=1